LPKSIAEIVGIKQDSLFNDPDLDKLTSRSLLVETLRGVLWEQKPVTVYKQGAGTGLTSGELVEIVPEMAEGSGTQHNQMDTQGLSMGRVKWASPEDPFTEGGDSGALVYMKLRDYIVPIGLHKGAKGTSSYCLLLDPCFNILKDIFEHDDIFCTEELCRGAGWLKRREAQVVGCWF
jgi:hypothetical protein